MSIHPEIVENDTMPLQFLSNLEVIFVNMRHAKIQNFRLVSLIVFELSDFVVLGFFLKNGRGLNKISCLGYLLYFHKNWVVT
jgi:hypothetical protein